MDEARFGEGSSEGARETRHEAEAEAAVARSAMMRARVGGEETIWRAGFKAASNGRWQV